MTNSDPNPTPRLLPVLKTALLTLYYLAIILMLLWMQFHNAFVTPKFIYQGF
jgi:hypothetical protein